MHRASLNGTGGRPANCREHDAVAKSAALAVPRNLRDMFLLRMDGPLYHPTDY